MSTTPLTGASADDAIKDKVEAALGFLRDDDAGGAMGMWGMGGVGKTTVLKRVNNALAKDPSAFGFHRVVFLVASRDCTVEKLRQLLRKELGLNDPGQIFGYLSNKSFVLLLDDLWRPMDLEQAGIPLPLGAVDGQCKRKLILTTRSQQVCASMGALAKRVDCLGRDAARRLFWAKAGGDAVKHSQPRVRELGDKVADECDGLPLALVTIGSAMAGTQTVQVWEDAVTQLRRSRPSKVPGMEPSEIPGMEDPLTRLKFSYDHLNDPVKQQCFLHCALWSEDYAIPREELVGCWMGHGLLGDDVDEIEEAYNRGYAIIDALQKACLLEPSERHIYVNMFVKLHDVIRDMALWIARDCGSNEKKWIVLDPTSDLPQDSRVWSEVHKLSSCGPFLYGGRRTRTGGFPSGIQSCPKLVTLILHYSPSLASSEMGAVKHFSQLKYLDLQGCPGLEEFPIEICSLIKLEYLDISDTVVHSLPNELGNLRDLKYLFARYNWISTLPGDLVANLASLFHLDLRSFGLCPSSLIDGLSCVKRRLYLGITAYTVSDIQKLVQLVNVRIRSLSIQGMEGTTSLRLLSGDVLGSKHMHSSLRWLEISYCAPTFEELVVDEEHHLCNLHSLHLTDLPGLREVIWKGVEPRNVLPNLCEIWFTECPLLKHVTWVVNLPCLQTMFVVKCENMEHLISAEALKIAGPYVIGFPSLFTLHMRDLPNLESIYHGVLDLPSLRHLHVSGCPRLTKLPFRSPPSLCNMKEINGEIGWWNNLEMDDDTRNILQPFFYINLTMSSSSSDEDRL